MTPEGRAKIAAAMKARWAAKKAAGKMEVVEEMDAEEEEVVVLYSVLRKLEVAAEWLWWSKSS